MQKQLQEIKQIFSDFTARANYVNELCILHNNGQQKEKIKKLSSITFPPEIRLHGSNNNNKPITASPQLTRSCNSDGDAMPNNREVHTGSSATVTTVDPQLYGDSFGCLNQMFSTYLDSTRPFNSGTIVKPVRSLIDTMPNNREFYVKPSATVACFGPELYGDSSGCFDHLLTTMRSSTRSCNSNGDAMPNNREIHTGPPATVTPVDPQLYGDSSGCLNHLFLTSTHPTRPYNSNGTVVKPVRSSIDTMPNNRELYVKPSATIACFGPELYGDSSGCFDHLLTTMRSSTRSCNSNGDAMPNNREIHTGPPATVTPVDPQLYGDSSGCLNHLFLTSTNPTRPYNSNGTVVKPVRSSIDTMPNNRELYVKPSATIACFGPELYGDSSGCFDHLLTTMKSSTRSCNSDGDTMPNNCDPNRAGYSHRISTKESPINIGYSMDAWNEQIDKDCRSVLQEIPETLDQEVQNEMLSLKPAEGVGVGPQQRNDDFRDVKSSLLIKPKNQLGCDSSDMYMETSTDSAKKLCCPFCEKVFSKLARHMENKHSQEPDVKKFLGFPKGSKKRRAVQDSLRKVGQINHNKNAALNNRKLIPSRRPNINHKRTAAKQTSCPYCFGSYAKSGLPFHIKYKCTEKPVEDHRTKDERVTSILASSVEARYHTNTNPRLKKVFDRCQNDDIVRGIKFDWLAIVYGNRLTSKYSKPRHIPMIQNRMRVIGRILKALKTIEPQVSELANLYLPEHYDRVVDAIRSVARVDEIRNEFVAPATASSAVTAIRQIGEMLIVEYIKKKDQEKRQITRDFLTVMNLDMHISINKMVNETQSRKARQKKVILPSSDDVKRLSEYLETERTVCFNELSESFTFKNWRRLTELTMSSIIVFNRRRVGDTQNIETEDFETKEIINEETNGELLSTLSEKSKEIALQHSRMKVRGKKDRTVPVLLKAKVDECLTLLIAHRQDAGVPSENYMLFGLPSKVDINKVVDAGRVLKKFAMACGAQNPSLLTATNLRKHLATVCVSLQLNDTTVADVADFMGHAEKVHREYYRQNTIERQIVQMSQLLEAAQCNLKITNPNELRTNQVKSNTGRKRKIPMQSADGAEKKKLQRVVKRKK